MNIEHIRTFLEIATTGNFHRAAKRLHVTQSTVSARIKSLEDQLERALFARGRSGVTLTAAGHHFQRHAVAAVRAWEQARQEVTLPEGYRTAFGIGSSTPELWERFGHRWIRRMRRDASDVALRIDVDYSENMLHNLSDGLLDIGIMYEPRSSPGLVVEKLVDERLVMVATKPCEREGDWRSDYVFVDWGYNYRVQHYEAFPDLPAPAVSLNLGDTGLKYLLAMGGAAYLTSSLARPYITEGRLFRVKRAPMFSRPAYVVSPEVPADADIMELALNILRSVTSGRAKPKNLA